jgi:hypothetical protein
MHLELICGSKRSRGAAGVMANGASAGRPHRHCPSKGPGSAYHTQFRTLVIPFLSVCRDPILSIRARDAWLAVQWCAVFGADVDFVWRLRPKTQNALSSAPGQKKKLTSHN